MNDSTKGVVGSGSLIRIFLCVTLAAAATSLDCVALAQAPAPPAPPRLTLADCIALGMQSQPGIQAQQAGVAMAQEVKNIAKSYYFPQVELNAALTQLNSHIYFRLPNPITGPLANVLTDAAAFFGIARQAGAAAAMQALGAPNMAPFSVAKQVAMSSLPPYYQIDVLGNRFLVAGVFVKQPVYTGGKIRYRNQQAELGIEAATAEVAKAKQLTAFAVSRAYFGILLTRALLDVTESTIGQFKAVESLAQSSLDEGVRSVSKADVSRAGALRELAESQRIEFQRASDLAWAGLRTAMGVDPQFPMEITDERLLFHGVNLDLPSLVGLALAQRPEIRQAKLAIRNAELEQKLAKAQYCPDVGLFGAYITIHDDANYLNPTNPDIFAGGIQAGVPLFAGGRRVAELRKAEWKAVQARDYLRLLEQSITLEVQKAYLEYKEMMDRIPLDEKAVHDAEETLKSYDDLYALGIESKDLPKHFENLVTTRLLLSTAQVGYNQHVNAYYVSLAKIDLATASHEPAPLPNRNELPAGARSSSANPRGYEPNPSEENSGNRDSDLLQHPRRSQGE